MKKFIAIAIAVLTVFSFTTVAFAENTTTLTTSVPDAEYTLNIPANQEIDFGVTRAVIGSITVTNSSGFAEGKDLNVTVDYTEFAATGVSTKIPFSVYLALNESSNIVTSSTSGKKIESGSVIVFEGLSSTEVNKFPTMDNSSSYCESMQLYFDSADWGKALAGDYTATITFTAEVVAE